MDDLNNPQYLTHSVIICLSIAKQKSFCFSIGDRFYVPIFLQTPQRENNNNVRNAISENVTPNVSHAT